MTRSIPSIIVLTLMCFTISYGIVRFPDAGILDAAQAPVLTTVCTSTKCQIVSNTSLKPTDDGTAILQDESPSSTALEEPQATTDDLFVTEQTTPPVKEAIDAASDKNASEKTADKAQDNKKKKSNKGGNKSKENKKSPEPEAKESELPKLESETVNSAADNNGSQAVIGIPDDQLPSDDSMPIETEDPLPKLDKTDPDIPSIFVDHNPSEFEPGPLSEPEQPEQEEIFIPDMSPETEESVDKFWEDRLNELAPSDGAASNNDNAPASSSAAENQPPATTMAIPTDPNAQDIPARNREQKPANQDALTLPALDEPQNVSPSANQPDTGTIPMETFQLDASAKQNVNYTAECEQEPYDPFGISIPETGEIIVKRLPPIENSVDPIYNNAQLDRFAL